MSSSFIAEWVLASLFISSTVISDCVLASLFISSTVISDWVKFNKSVQL